MPTNGGGSHREGLGSPRPGLAAYPSKVAGSHTDCGGLCNGVGKRRDEKLQGRPCPIPLWTRFLFPSLPVSVRGWHWASGEKRKVAAAFDHPGLPYLYLVLLAWPAHHHHPAPVRLILHSLTYLDLPVSPWILRPPSRWYIHIIIVQLNATVRFPMALQIRRSLSALCCCFATRIGYTDMATTDNNSNNNNNNN